METVVSISIAFVILFIAAVVFIGWVAVSVAKSAGRGILSVAKVGFAGPALLATEKRCTRGNCRATNPVSASFCRRCGRRLQE
jgi:hypothetical protein